MNVLPSTLLQMCKSACTTPVIISAAVAYLYPPSETTFPGKFLSYRSRAIRRRRHNILRRKPLVARNAYLGRLARGT